MPTAQLSPGTLSPALDSLKVAFTDQMQLWLWQAGSIQALTDLDEEMYTDVKLSDDGKLIAFRRAGGLWVIGSDGSNERQLVSGDFFASLEPVDPGVGLKQFDWVPGTHVLFFNTLLYGYGINYANDLYRVDADTLAWERLRAPGDGGDFFFSPDGRQVVLVTPVHIRVMDVNNTNVRTLLEYYVSTYSEFYYYAEPQWEPDGRTLVVVIPPEDYTERLFKPSTVWRLYPDGPRAELLYEVQPENYEDLLKIWSPEKDHYAVFSQGDSRYYLGAEGQKPEPLTERVVTDWGVRWIDETHFLYKGRYGLMIGTIGAPGVLIVDGRQLNGGVDTYDFQP